MPGKLFSGYGRDPQRPGLPVHVYGWRARRQPQRWGAQGTFPQAIPKARRPWLGCESDQVPIRANEDHIPGTYGDKGRRGAASRKGSRDKPVPCTGHGGWDSTVFENDQLLQPVHTERCRNHEALIRGHFEAEEAAGLERWDDQRIQRGENGAGENDDAEASQTGCRNRNKHGRVRRSSWRSATTASQRRRSMGTVGILQQEVEASGNQIQRVRPRIAHGISGDTAFPPLPGGTDISHFHGSSSNVCYGQECGTVVAQAGQAAWIHIAVFDRYSARGRNGQRRSGCTFTSGDRRSPARRRLLQDGRASKAGPGNLSV